MAAMPEARRSRPAFLCRGSKGKNRIIRQRSSESRCSVLTPIFERFLDEIPSELHTHDSSSVSPILGILCTCLAKLSFILISLNRAIPVTSWVCRLGMFRYRQKIPVLAVGVSGFYFLGTPPAVSDFRNGLNKRQLRDAPKPGAFIGNLTWLARELRVTWIWHVFAKSFCDQEKTIEKKQLSGGISGANREP
jgi:hypothetical protein